MTFNLFWWFLSQILFNSDFTMFAESLSWDGDEEIKFLQVHAAFNVLDSDRDGFVTRSDFKKKFHNLNSKQIDVVFQR